MSHPVPDFGVENKPICQIFLENAAGRPPLNSR